MLDQPDPENPIIVDDQTRRYQRLSEEEKAWVFGAVRILLQEGHCPPKLDDSLLCLDWSLFHPRRFPEHEHDPNFKTPPEFRTYALSALDAYVTALLNTRLHARAGEMFHYTCSLKQDAEAQLQMELKTSPAQPGTGSRRVMIELLNSFPRLLKARRIEAEEVAYSYEGHRMGFAYPGKMVASRSPYLCDRPVELWPSVTLSLAATDELVTRARQVTEFLLNPEAGDGIAN